MRTIILQADFSPGPYFFLPCFFPKDPPRSARSDPLMKPATKRFLVFLCLPLGLQAADLPKDLLEAKCLSCHYPEKDKDKGKLDMSTRAKILSGGDSGPVIDLEKPDQSEILLRVRLPHDDDDIMPPAKKGKPLTTEEIAQLAEDRKSVV